MNKKRGIKNQIFNVIFIINIVFILVIVSYTAYTNATYSKRMQDESMTDSNGNMSTIISEWMDNRLRELELYSNLNLVKSLDKDFSLLLINSMNYEGIKSFDYFFINDSKGKYVSSNFKMLDNIVQEDFFKSVLKGERVITFYKDQNNKDSYVFFSVPIYDDKSQIIGILTGVMNHDKVETVMSEFNIQKNIHVLLVDSEGSIVYNNDNKSEIITDHIFKHDEVTKEFLGRDNISYLNKYESNSNVYYFSKIKVTKNWNVVYKIDKNVLFQNMAKNFVVLFALGVALLCFSFFISRILANKIAKPITDLRNVFLQASTGDLYIRADDSYGDEIGEANKGFNLMMDKIINMTYKDNLTGRTNYNYFVENLETEIKEAKSDFGFSKFSVMVLGVDNFKMINDSYGFEIGNEVLRAVAELSFEASNNIFDISRLGGDEFGVLIKSSDPELDSYRYIKKLNKLLKNGVEIQGNKIYISVSAGISVFPENGDTPSELMKGAYIALNRGKDRARGDMEVYSEHLRDELLEQVELSMMIVDSLEKNEFYLNYQPIKSISADRISSVEILARWDSKTKGMIEPSKFIPIAESSRQIIPLGRFILFEGCKGLKRMQDEVDSSISGTINISVIQLLDTNFIKDLEEAISLNSLDPNTLILEITERVLMDDSEKLLILINRIKRIGCKIALDDFGTGYSSLSYLSKYPVDILKIDKSFIQKLEIKNDANRTLVETMIAISNKMKIQIIAEGVETLNQLKQLSEMGCDYIQGYYISRPKGLDEIIYQINDQNI